MVLKYKYPGTKIVCLPFCLSTYEPIFWNPLKFYHFNQVFQHEHKLKMKIIYTVSFCFTMSGENANFLQFLVIQIQICIWLESEVLETASNIRLCLLQNGACHGVIFHSVLVILLFDCLHCIYFILTNNKN